MNFFFWFWDDENNKEKVKNIKIKNLLKIKKIIKKKKERATNNKERKFYTYWKVIDNWEINDRYKIIVVVVAVAR